MKVKFLPLDKESWEWVYSSIKPVYTKQTKGIVARNSDTQEILAVTIFDTWLPTSGQIHVAISNPMVLRHGYIEECMNYFFNTAEKELLLGVTPSDNLKALKFNRHIGLTELFRIKDGFRFGVDLVIQELRKDDCRWINGQTRYSCAA